MKHVVLLLTLTAALLTGCVGPHSASEKSDAAQRTWGSWADDQALEAAVTQRIRAAGGALKRSRVKVISHNGIVLLIGQVTSESLKRLTGEAAAKAPKVRHIHNQIVVSTSLNIFRQSSDSVITSQIKSVFLTDSVLRHVQIKVNTESKIVYLMGITTPAVGERAAQLAKETYGVTEVVKVFEYL